MNKIKIVVLIMLTLILAACSFNRNIESTNYYILDYNGCNEQQNLKLKAPYNYTVQINETRLPRTYDRNQIVSKYTFNQITYLKRHLWSSKLYDAIPNLISQRIKCYNIFKRVGRVNSASIPDFYIDTNVSNIEQYLDDGKQFAHLKMEFILKSGKDNKELFSYNNDRTKRVYSTGIDGVVSTLNDLILEETNTFSRLIVSYLEKKEIPDDSLIEKLAEANKDFEEISGNINNVGELLVPAIYDGEMEPEYYIYSSGGDFIEEATMGDVIRLPKDEYKLRIGTDQLIDTQVEVKAGYRRVIKPTWGVLIVNIIDEDRNDVKMRYEIFQENDERVRSFGTYYSSSDRITEPPDAHVLLPGMYKLTINGRPFNTYIDFTSVTISEEETYELTIVVESLDENEVSSDRKLLGAGVIRSESDRRISQNGKWDNALYVIANFNSDNKTAEDDRKTSMTFIGEFDNKYDYEKGPFHYSMKSLYSIELNWETDEDFKVKNDDYNLENTVIYNVMGGLGLYGRADLACHFSPTYDYISNGETRDIELRDADNNVSDYLTDRDKFKYQPTIFPLVLKEGAGLNYRFFQNISSVKMSIRGGIGWEQEVYHDTYSQQSSSDSLYVYRELENDYTTGFELSALGTLSMKKMPVDYTLSADFLFPFDANDEAKYDIENILTLNLIKNVSWDIKATFTKGVQGRDYWVLDYGTFLRLSLFY